MTVLGFHYTKIAAEKKKAPSGKVKVSNNVVLTSVKEAKIGFGDSKQKGVEFGFSYKATYDPEIATITLDGAIVFMSTEAKVKETLTKWQKEKKLPDTVLEEVYNYLLEKCTIEALVLGKDMQLPPHVPLPKVKR